ACGYSGSFQFTSFPPTFRSASTSFSARQNNCFLKMACAAGAGTLHASMPVNGARNTPSGDPYSRSNRADSRAAMPGVNVNASHEREASSSTPRAYVYSNRIVKYRQVDRTATTPGAIASAVQGGRNHFAPSLFRDARQSKVF